MNLFAIYQNYNQSIRIVSLFKVLPMIPIFQKHRAIYKDLEDAASYLDRLQTSAKNSGTYAVAGALVDSKGRVIYEQQNRVIEPLYCGKTFILDPTNHGEMQIVRWYWQNKKALQLPDPKELTIITTLDPCLMCAFSIIKSGFNVGVISLDPHGGVNFGLNQFANFNFAPFYRKTLLETFGYYKITGSQQRIQYTYQASNVAFKDYELRFETEEQLDEVFRTSTNIVRKHKQSIGLPPNKLHNLKNLQPNHKLIAELKILDQYALSMTLTDKIISDKGQSKHHHHFEPTQELKAILEKVLHQTPLAQNSAALIDPYGNLLLARADRFDISPIDTAIFRLVTEYSQFRFKLINQSSINGKVIQQSPAYQYLSSLDYCTFVFLNSMPGDQSTTLLNIGIYAVAIKRDTEQSRLMYINGYSSTQSPTLEEIMKHLPPAYTQKHKHIRPIQANIGKHNQH